MPETEELNKTITKAADMFNNGIPIQLLTEDQRTALNTNLNASIEQVKPTRKYYIERIIKVLDTMVSIQNASGILKQQTTTGKFFTPAYKKEASSEQYKTLRDELNKIKYTGAGAGAAIIFPNNPLSNGYADRTVNFWKDHLSNMNDTTKTATMVIGDREYQLTNDDIPVIPIKDYSFSPPPASTTAAVNPLAAGGGENVDVAAGGENVDVAAGARVSDTGGGAANVGVVATATPPVVDINGGSSSRKTRNKRRRRRRRATRRW